MKSRLLISFSMPRGLKRGDFYNEYLVFEEGKLTFILENISQQKVEKKVDIPYQEKDYQALLETASHSSKKPLQTIFDMTISYAEITDSSGEKERFFVNDSSFWEIARSYLPKE